MGSGDWNDGMNRVGHEGRGESVWLGWFLCRWWPTSRRWHASAAKRRARCAGRAPPQGWKRALNGPAWDGQWFKRAFFDDGQALGSHANAEARIDLIAQAWAVLSGAAPAALQRMALAAVEEHLVDHEAGLIRAARPAAGARRAERRLHPGLSAGRARERRPVFARRRVGADGAGRVHADAQASRSHASGGDTAYRYFTYLSPAHRARHPTHGAAYGIEPYVMAGDVYTQPPYVGRGGWSWYTGAAAWMHRAAIESIFGLRLGAQELCFTPCLPSHWNRGRD